MQFGEIDNLILFGGGQRLVNLISVAKRYKLMVISATRLLKSKLDSEGMDVESFLKENKIRYFEVDDINSVRIDPFINENTLGISLGAPWIFSIDFINKFKGRLINGHGRKLPQNRGGGGYSWQIMRGENFGYHLFHLVDKGIDTGSIIFFDEFLFPPTCRTPKDYEDFFAKTEVEFFKEFFKRIESNFDFKEIVQQEYFSTYFPRLSTLHHGFINWNWRAQDIERFICAFDLPYKGASTFIEGKRVFLRGVTKDTSDGYFHPFMNGLIYRKTNNSLFVAVSDGTILVEEAYNEEGRDVFDKIRVGHRFVTPIKFLEEALLFYAVYDTKGLKPKG